MTTLHIYTYDAYKHTVNRDITDRLVDHTVSLSYDLTSQNNTSYTISYLSDSPVLPDDYASTCLQYGTRMLGVYDASTVTSEMASNRDWVVRAKYVSQLSRLSYAYPTVPYTITTNDNVTTKIGDILRSYGINYVVDAANIGTITTQALTIYKPGESTWLKIVNDMADACGITLYSNQDGTILLTGDLSIQGAPRRSHTVTSAEIAHLTITSDARRITSATVIGQTLTATAQTPDAQITYTGTHSIVDYSHNSDAYGDMYAQAYKQLTASQSRTVTFDMRTRWDDPIAYGDRLVLVLPNERLYGYVQATDQVFEAGVNLTTSVTMQCW